MKPSPAFQFYPHDFLVGTADLTSEEVGAYIRLLCYQWTKQGLPNNDAKLAQLGVCDGNAIASIRHKFGICQDGLLRNERLEKVRESQEEYRKRQSNNAKEGWKHRVGNATAMPPHMPEACSSSSSSSSIKKEEEAPLLSKEAEKALSGYQKHPGTTHPSKNDLLKLWNSEYPSAHDGDKYHYVKENDDIAINSLLSLMMPEEIMDIARRGWKSDTIFIRSSSSDFKGLNSQWNKIVASVRPFKKEAPKLNILKNL